MSTIAHNAGAHAHPDNHGHGHPQDKLALVKQLVSFSTDHKVIGIQFLMTTMLMLLVGGALALGVRWQLAFPWESMPIFGAFAGAEGGQISPEFYTMLFTMHATVMIFLVIIPVSGRSVRKLPDPADDRGRRHGVSDAQHAQLLVYVAGDRLFWPGHSCRGGSGMDVVSRVVCAAAGRAGFGRCSDVLVDRGHVCRRLVDDGIGQLHDDHYQHAGTRHDAVPHAAHHLGHVHHRDPAGVRVAGSDRGRLHAGLRPTERAAWLDELDGSRLLRGGPFLLLRACRTGRQQCRPDRRRRSAAVVAAPVLVLFAPGGVHHAAARDGDGLRHAGLHEPQADLRLQADGVFDGGDRRSGIHRLGSPHVYQRDESRPGHDVHGVDDHDRAALRGEGLQLDRHDVGRRTRTSIPSC